MATAAAGPARCRNCGEPTGPRYCGHCGQAVERERRTAWALLSELAAEWFSLEGRLFRTLATLWRPGRLTVLNLDGKRAPFLTPMRLYLLASLLLFSSVLTLQPPDVRTVNLTVGGVPLHEADSDGTDAEVNLELFKPGQVSTRVLSLDEQVERLRSRPPQEVVDTLFASLRRVLPAALILCLPLLGLVLKLLYIRTGTLYADHLVFAVHFQSALFVVLAVAWLIVFLFGLGLIVSLPLYVAVLFLMLLVYLPLALRHVYRQGRWLTALKTVLLVMGYFRLLGLALGLSYLWAMWRL